jgi:hypothetical protein
MSKNTLFSARTLIATTAAVALGGAMTAMAQGAPEFTAENATAYRRPAPMIVLLLETILVRGWLASMPIPAHGFTYRLAFATRSSTAPPPRSNPAYGRGVWLCLQPKNPQALA